MGHCTGRTEPASRTSRRFILDETTQLSKPRRYWQFSVYPDADEAVITYVNLSDRARVDLSDGDADADNQDDHHRNDRYANGYADRAELRRRHRRRRASRARSRLRRYVIANRLHVHVTLTFAHDRGGLRAGPGGRAFCAHEVGRFLKALCREEGRMPLAYTLEANRKGGGWHVHMLLPRWISHHVIGRMWGRGGVKVTDIALDPKLRDRPMNVAVRVAADRASAYLAKQWPDLELLPGDHLYEVAQGFAPKVYKGIALTLAEGLARVRSLFGFRQPISVWDSSQAVDWLGPPVYVLRWGTRCPP